MKKIAVFFVILSFGLISCKSNEKSNSNKSNVENKPTELEAISCLRTKGKYKICTEPLQKSK